MARWCGSSISAWILSEYYWRIWINWEFYYGRQWLFAEDVTVFLQDADGNSRGRRRINNNFIRTYVETLVGEANKMSLDFKVKSVGDGVINRREKELLKIKTMRVMADMFPSLEKTIKRSSPIGNTMDETEEIFRNVWTDQYEKTVNNLIKYVTSQNKLDTVISNFLRKELAVTGMAVVQQVARRGNLIIRPISSENFFFDPAALFPDLTDSEYMGDTEFSMPTDLYEQYDLSKDVKEDIEKATRYMPSSSQIYMPMPYAANYIPGRVPKINTEWRDTEKQDWGFVKDDYGYEYLTRVYPNNQKGTEKKYHYEDLIEPQSERNKTFMKGQKKIVRDIEVIRFCRMTPREAISSTGNTDICYEYGIVPYQETYCENPTISEFTYKAQLMDYHDGYIGTPLDNLIDLQRVLNRAESLAEYRMETVGGANVMIDKRAASGGDMTISDIELRQQQGLPITLDGSRLGGLQNAVVPYGQNVERNIMGFIEYRNALKAQADQMTGVFLPNVRESKKALLGQEEEASSLHSTYLKAVELHYEQMIQGIANRGRKVYVDSPRRLAIAVGDEGAKEIVITQNMLLEDFRIFVKRTDNEAMSKEKAMAVLTQWYGNALISKAAWANNVGNATMDDLSKIAKDSYVRDQAAQKAAEEGKQKQIQMATMQNAATQERADNQEQSDKMQEQAENEKDRMAKNDQIILRGHAQMERDKQKAKLKQEEMRLKAELEANKKAQEAES